ncbi:unnamed protein product [Linum tenue]|uniref:Uncharacterized protein n=1 Tax=Linum tenue TaxID=586396 RepID=A0AAV0P2I3_9ROSI|nr:unnamed protein product [Linum tenue]
MEDANQPAAAGDEIRWVWWGVGSVILTGCGISSLRRGYDGSCGLMPLKAFAIASLFVGSAAAASVSALHASGIHKVVEDFVHAGANLRARLGIPSRPHHHKRNE